MDSLAKIVRFPHVLILSQLMAGIKSVELLFNALGTVNALKMDVFVMHTGAEKTAAPICDLLVKELSSLIFL
jgi:hypothetical protein